jgi:hypothetical protein
MKIVISTQFRENYGAHDWDGTGECPQYWKFKGGNEYIIDNIQEHVKMNDFFGKKCEMIVDSIRPKIEHKSEYAEEYILGWTIEEDSYMSEFEKSQMEYDGVITHKEPRLDIDGNLIPREKMVA